MKTMFVKQICWVLAGLVAACCAEAGGETFTFQQGKDHGWGVYTGAADITLDNPTHNEPTNIGVLRVQYFNSSPIYDETHNTLIRFSGIEEVIGNDGSSIESASLTLTYKYIKRIIGRANIDLYPVMKDWEDPNWFLPWTEAGAQNQPLDRGNIMDVDITSGDMGDRTFSNQYDTGEKFSFEISADLIRIWVEDPASNYGILLAMNPLYPSDTTFFSSDDPGDPSNHPLLTITVRDCMDLLADINKDCYVDLYDMVEIAGNWLASGELAADISDDNYVDLDDFSIISRDWMKCSDPGNPDCTCGKYVSDLDGNCIVDIADLTMMADQWLSETGGTADLNKDGKVNLLDYVIFLQEWYAQQPDPE